MYLTQTPSSFTQQTKFIKPFVIILFFVFFTIISCPVLAEQTNLAEDDYAAYKASEYSSSQWDQVVKTGMEAFHSGVYDVANTSLYKAFNQGCESPILLFMLALLNEHKESFYSALEYYQMAQKGFKKANQDHRYNKEFDENYGRALYYSGKIDQAMPILKRAGKSSKSYWLLKLLGMLSYEQGDALNALSYLERAVRVKSDDVTKEELIYIYNLLGKLFLYKNEQEGAVRYYQKTLDLDPNNPEAQRFISGLNKTDQNQDMIKLMEKLKDM